MNVLLVEPKFPIPPKSKNHRDFLPIGLLKFASYHINQKDKIRLIRGNRKVRNFRPDEIKISSLFTYWSTYVWDSVKFYKETYPNAKIIVGGIYASLMPEHCKMSGCDEVFIGVDEDVDKCNPAYDLVDVDYQIIHTSRGCIRKCKYCGVWKIEPKFEYKRSIKDEISSNRIIFYDNNLLANPYIQDILKEISDTKYNGQCVYCECQCGIDGRLLTPELATLLKKARFVNIRVAWDHSYSEHKSIKKQIDILINAGYSTKDIYVFMLYNWDYDFKEMERKRIKCWDWKVQIADCRYRPLNRLHDNYNPRIIGQTSKDYYIHEKANWTDNLLKQFRKNVRRQNICIRHGFPFYSKDFEHKQIKEKVVKATKDIKIKKEKIRYLKKNEISYWFPNTISYSN